MNTIENNKIIAEFMDFPLILKSGEVAPITDGLAKTLYKDWNSLMPVIEKIESIESETARDFDVSIRMEYCNIKYSIQRAEELGKKAVLFEFMDTTKIGATYKTIVEFIKWYNQQEK